MGTGHVGMDAYGSKIRAARSLGISRLGSYHHSRRLETRLSGHSPRYDHQLASAERLNICMSVHMPSEASDRCARLVENMPLTVAIAGCLQALAGISIITWATMSISVCSVSLDDPGSTSVSRDIRGRALCEVWTPPRLQR